MQISVCAFHYYHSTHSILIFLYEIPHDQVLLKAPECVLEQAGCPLVLAALHDAFDDPDEVFDEWHPDTEKNHSVADDDDDDEGLTGFPGFSPPSSTATMKSSGNYIEVHHHRAASATMASSIEEPEYMELETVRADVAVLASQQQPHPPPPPLPPSLSSLASVTEEAGRRAVTVPTTTTTTSKPKQQAVNPMLQEIQNFNKGTKLKKRYFFVFVAVTFSFLSLSFFLSFFLSLRMTML